MNSYLLYGGETIIIASDSVDALKDSIGRQLNGVDRGLVEGDLGREFVWLDVITESGTRSLLIGPGIPILVYVGN